MITSPSQEYYHQVKCIEPCLVFDSTHEVYFLQWLIHLCVSVRYIYINTNFIENKTFSVYIFSCWSVHIAVLLLSYSVGIDVFSIIVYIPSTFCPTLGHHQGRIYYKSDVTFVFALLLYKSVFTIGVCSVCF